MEINEKRKHENVVITLEKWEGRSAAKSEFIKPDVCSLLNNSTNCLRINDIT